MTCLDMPYNCEVITYTAQHQQGVIIVFKVSGHTIIDEYITNFIDNEPQLVNTSPILVEAHCYQVISFDLHKTHHK